MSFFKDILPVAGGIVGAAFGPMGAALGSGIGSLLAGGSPKDAILSGIISGAGAKMFPGVGESVAGATGIGSEQMIKQAALQKELAKEAASRAVAGEAVKTAAAKKAAEQGILSNLGGKMYLAGTVASLFEEPEKLDDDTFDQTELESDPSYIGKPISQFQDPVTGERINTLEEYKARLKKYEEEGFNFREGGYVQGPGTGTSDDIPAKIYQNGQPVQEARLSDGEFVMTKKAVDGAGGAARMYEMMKQYERMA